MYSNDHASLDGSWRSKHLKTAKQGGLEHRRSQPRPTWVMELNRAQPHLAHPATQNALQCTRLDLSCSRHVYWQTSQTAWTSGACVETTNPGELGPQILSENPRQLGPQGPEWRPQVLGSRDHKNLTSIPGSLAWLAGLSTGGMRLLC